MKQEHLHLLTCRVSLILYVCARWKNAANTGQRGRRRGELLWGVMLFCYEWCWHWFLLSFLWANIDSGHGCPALGHGKSGFLPARDFQNLQDKMGKENVAHVVQRMAFVALCGNDQTSKLVIGNFGENIWSIEAKIQVQTCPPATLTSHFNLSGGFSFYPLNISQCKST